MASFNVTIDFESDLPAFADAAGLKIRRATMRGALRFEALAKLRYRQDVERAGLGSRLANTWRTEAYPLGAISWHPAVVVHSNAPEIVSAHADGVTIRSKNGVFLAIPTDNVPRRAGHRMTPDDIETEFNQDLVLKKSNRPGVYLAFVTATPARSGHGFRRLTKRRQAAGRAAELVLMFILVRQVTLRPVLNWRGLEKTLGPNFREFIAEEISQELAA